MTVTRRGRRSIERWRHRALIVGFSFAAGALIDTALTWRLHEFDTIASPESFLNEASATSGSAVSADPERPSARTRRPGSAGGDGHTAVSGTSGVITERTALDTLDDRDLLMPVEGVPRSTLRDTYGESRSGGRSHEALDIMAPRGTAVRAVEDGTVAKLFNSKAGGLTVYQFDPSGRFCYYYAHLGGYAKNLAEGESLKRGEVIGYVGSTGNASPDAPHLHFAVFRLGPERQWWKGEPVNPYPVFAGK